MELRQTWPVLVTTMVLGLTGCGSSSKDPSASDTGSTDSSATSGLSDAPASSDAPTEVKLPTTLDKGKFCKAVNEKDVEAAMGVPIAKRATEGRDPKNAYCYYENKQQTVGVTIIWLRNPTNPVRETRKILAGDPAYNEARCQVADVGSLDSDLAFQASCAGYKKPGAFFPRKEELFFQVGKTTFYCQVYAPPRQALGVDANGAASLCQGAYSSLA